MLNTQENSRLLLTHQPKLRWVLYKIEEIDGERVEKYWTGEVTERDNPRFSRDISKAKFFDDKDDAEDAGMAHRKPRIIPKNRRITRDDHTYVSSVCDP